MSGERSLAFDAEEWALIESVAQKYGVDTKAVVMVAVTSMKVALAMQEAPPEVAALMAKEIQRWQARILRDAAKGGSP